MISLKSSGKKGRLPKAEKKQVRSANKTLLNFKCLIRHKVTGFFIVLPNLLVYYVAMTLSFILLGKNGSDGHDTASLTG